jgi:hypothetical protein
MIATSLLDHTEVGGFDFKVHDVVEKKVFDFPPDVIAHLLIFRSYHIRLHSLLNLVGSDILHIL